MAGRVREKNVEAYLSKKLSKMNLHCYKVLPDNRIGMPDRIVTLPGGRCVWVELKTDGGELSMVQRLRHKELKASGQDVRVIWNKAEADRFTEELGNSLLPEK